MKVGDIVTMKHALTPERYGLGLIQKIVGADFREWKGELRLRLSYSLA